MGNHSYTTHSDINIIIKQILLEEATGGLFIEYFGNRWDLENIFRRFDAELVDIELLSSLDKLLHESKTEVWYVDNILTSLIYKIKNDEVKKHLYQSILNVMQKHLIYGIEIQKTRRRKSKFE